MYSSNKSTLMAMFIQAYKASPSRYLSNVQNGISLQIPTTASVNFQVLAAHPLDVVIICTKYFRNPSQGWEMQIKHRKQTFMLLPYSVTLTLSRHPYIIKMWWTIMSNVTCNCWQWKFKKRKILKDKGR